VSRTQPTKAIRVFKDKQIKIFAIVGWIIKIVVITFSFYYIYRHIFLIHDPYSFLNLLKENIYSPKNGFTVLIVVVLVFVNWGIESMKWRYLIAKFRNISFWKAYKAVLTGVTVSLVSPNRTGEFLGRVFHLGFRDRFTGSICTFYGSIAQLIITIIMGVVAICILAPLYLVLGPVEERLAIALMVLVPVLLVFLYSLLPLWVSGFAGRFPNSKMGRILLHCPMVSMNDLFKLLGMSWLRYFVFSLQFYLVLNLMGVDFGIISGFLHIAVTYFFMTILPTLSLFELGVRTSISLEVIGLISYNNSGIIAASLAIWIINLAIPAIFGSLYLLKVKILQSK
jgi:hypothetical protein